MTDTSAPWEYLDVANQKRPLYIIKFDEGGHCRSPQAKEAFLDELKAGQYSDLLFFSHGWNNDWDYATGRYRDFINQFHALAAKHADKLPAAYKPLFVGIFWPSVSLLLPWEEAPGIASAEAKMDPEQEAIADLLQEPEKTSFLSLARRDKLTNPEALALASIFARLSSAVDDVTQHPQTKLTAEEILACWKSAPSPVKSAAGDGLTTPDPGVATDAPRPGAGAAGILDYLDPRWLIRLGTVRIMKDRAGVVGANGVAELLKDILAAAPVRVHAIGHSYGAKVLLSAASRLTSGKPSSLLLLQPAVSYLCFAKDIGSGVPGGYHGLTQKFTHPIFATFSSNDFPLRNVYHYALRREADLGEIQIAAAVPSRYAALGGYGPPDNAAGGVVIKALSAPGVTFPMFDHTVQVVGFEASTAISGHGDVLNDPVYWALLQQMA